MISPSIIKKKRDSFKKSIVNYIPKLNLQEAVIRQGQKNILDENLPSDAEDNYDQKQFVNVPTIRKT